MTDLLTLGFEVGTGTPVNIPRKHLVITGQTQEAGKTTAVEGLIARSNLRAITFITKPGEGSFQDAVPIQPYFREHADWQYVAAILEASRGEKLKFERAWIIRASKNALTLADVQRNVRKSLEKARGLSADVYLTLDAYLDVVVPQIQRTQWASRLDIQPGVNVMDLTRVAPEMQHLVMRSALEWVLEHESSTVLVIPEAWKFLPQGRGTPVKLAAEAYIRQGAALQNYLWLDSQDLGNLEKTILRSVPVWLLGVQREANEIKRTLDNIPAGIAKPKAADLATLELGQFYACWGRHTVKVYAQPAWLPHHAARDVAQGRRPVPPPPKKASMPTTDVQFDVLRNENARLKEENLELKSRLQILENKLFLQKELTEFVPLATSTPARLPEAPKAPAVPPTAVDAAPHTVAYALVTLETYGDNEEARYAAYKERLLAEATTDPVLLKVLTQRPELNITVSRVTIQTDGSSLRGRLAQLIVDRWFTEPKNANQARLEMIRRGRSFDPKGVYRECDNLAELGFLTKEKDGYQAVPGMIVRIVEGS